jgi:hypothetical protein
MTDLIEQAIANMKPKEERRVHGVDAQGHEVILTVEPRVRYRAFRRNLQGYEVRAFVMAPRPGQDSGLAHEFFEDENEARACFERLIQRLKDVSPV